MKVEAFKIEGLTRDTYFNIGDERDLVLSNSALSKLNPNQGGSPGRFKAFLANKSERDDSMSLERGRLLHKYVEDPKSFAIAPETLPGDSVRAIIDLVFKKRKEIGIMGVLGDWPTEILTAATDIQYGNGKYKTDTILTKVVESAAYYAHLVANDGKHMVDDGTRKSLMGMITSLENHTDIREYLIDKKVSEYDTPQQAYLMGATTWVAKEYPIAFKIDGIPAKALLDYIEVDFIKKTILYRDAKTTSKPVMLFMGSTAFEKIPNEPKLYIASRNGSFQMYHYYRQFAFYRLAIKSLFSEEDIKSYGMAFVNDVFESVSPYEIMSHLAEAYWIQAGESEIELILKIVKDYIKYEKLDTF